MRGFIWSSLVLLLLGTLGIFANIYLGFGLTRDTAAQADLHLTCALASVSFLILGSVGLIQSSKKQLLLRLRQGSEEGHELQDLRQRCLSLALVGIAVAILSMITGTISQAGRFPLVHGLIGFALAGLSFATIYLWINLARRI
jgi:hypothetical protein